MRVHDLRLAPAAGGGIAASVAAAQGVAWWSLAAAALAVAVLAVAARAFAPRGPMRGVAVSVAAAAAIVSVLCASAAVRADLATPGAAREAWAAGGEAAVWGTVTSEPEPAARDAWTGLPRTRWTLDADHACREPCEEAWPVRWRVQVVSAAGAEALRLGERVRVTGWVAGPADASGRTALWADESLVVAPPPLAWRAVQHLRDAAREAASTLPEPVRALTVGMVIGDTSAMDPGLSADMRATSLTHLTAVSGSHFAIVVMTVGAALRRLTSARRLRAVVLAAAMASLAAVVGPEPSVLRALTMALAVALGWWWGRPAAAMAALSVGVLALLAWDPGLGARLGFQLSVAAVSAIVLWAPAIARGMSPWLPRLLAHAIAVPVAAYGACWPLLIPVDPRLAAYAVPANLVAAVAAIPVTTIGLAAMLVGAVWPPAGAALMQLAGASAWPVVWAARGFATAPGASVPWPTGAVGVTLAVAVVGLAVAATSLRRAGPAWRAAVGLVAVVASLAVPRLGVTAGPVADDWAIVVCDVGQGDAMLVRAGPTAAVMIDTGPPGGAGAACAERYGVRDVPLLVLTHPHADHDGAVAEIAAQVRLREVWTSPAALGDGLDEATEAARATGATVGAPAVGTVVDVGQARVRVWWPPPTQARSSAEINDASVVVAVSSGGVTALALGDLETDGQRGLAAALAGPVVVDLVKVAHHGAAAQSDQLTRLLTARVAAISVGSDNPYGHPAASTVEGYSAVATLVLTTAECGDIAVRRGGEVASRCHGDVAG